MISRFRVLALFCSLATVTDASAQVIECPGALPAASLNKAQTLTMAGRLFGRFTAALNLHGLSSFDEAAILERYRDHPEQLLTKLTYLTLQCQMVLLDGIVPTEARNRAVRRVFLNYVLQPADPAADGLAAYVTAFASDGGASTTAKAAVDADIARIEEALTQSPRGQWRERWFLDPPLSAEGRPNYSVIIASPRYEDDGWQALRSSQARWPDIHFELDGPYDLESPHYAIVVGRGLDQAAATRLLGRIGTMGLPDDSYLWQAPATARDESS